MKRGLFLFAEKLGGRRLKLAAGLNLHPKKTLGSVGRGMRGQIIEILARKLFGLARNHDRADRTCDGRERS